MTMCTEELMAPRKSSVIPGMKINDRNDNKLPKYSLTAAVFQKHPKYDDGANVVINVEKCYLTCLFTKYEENCFNQLHKSQHRSPKPPLVNA